MRLTEIGETGLIQRIQSRLNLFSPRTVLGIGDDAAAVQGNGEMLSIVTTDMLVEGSHFIWGKISPHDLGYKSLAVNLSDIAAMGGRPLHAVVSLGLPPHLPVEDIDAFYDGMQELALSHGMDIIGGDITASPLGFVISVTVIGEVNPAHLITQSGAQEGDLVAVTGELGGSAAGLAVLLNEQVEFPAPTRELALTKHFRPLPRVKAGLELAATGKLHAMKDISDGLAKELNTIATASNKMIIVKAEAVPISPAALVVGAELDRDPMLMALQGGEDYELLFTFSPGDWEVIRTTCQRLDVPVHVIGQVGPGQGVYIEKEGLRARLTFCGYSHF